MKFGFNSVDTNTVNDSGQELPSEQLQQLRDQRASLVDVSREQMLKELAEAGWERRGWGGEPDEENDPNAPYNDWFWPPVMKEVVDTEATRSCGIFREEAYAMLQKRKHSQQLKETRYTGDRKICCNKCSLDMRKYISNAELAKQIPMTPAEPKDEPMFGGVYGLVETTVSGGYLSDFLHDTINYRFSLCEKCLKELFDTFVIPVEVETYL